MESTMPSSVYCLVWRTNSAADREPKVQTPLFNPQRAEVSMAILNFIKGMAL